MNCLPLPIIKNREDCISKTVSFDICQNYFWGRRLSRGEAKSNCAIHAKTSQSVSQQIPIAYKPNVFNHDREQGITIITFLYDIVTKAEGFTILLAVAESYIIL
jgi:hypothetical protein